MNILKSPEWIKKYEFLYNKIYEVPASIFEEINTRLDRIIKPEPLVSIIIAAYNEEINVLRCLGSLSATATKLPIEIIVVNNNSKDGTQQTLEKFHIKTLFQPIQGCGPARQLGQEQAKGKYVLLADADCIYPPQWIDEMMKILTKKDVVCVYGRYSFIEDKQFSRFELSLLELMKDAIAEVRHFKRPYLNAFGISMGYVKEFGLKAGYIMHNTRGDDGRLCFDLMNYGNVKQVKSGKARVWTGTRTLQKDGGFIEVLKNRASTVFKNLASFTKAHPPHDTKTSGN